MADGQWMYADVVAKVPGFPLGHLNPMRWSKKLPLKSLISTLEEIRGSGRPIIVKLWQNSKSKLEQFDGAQHAIDYLKRINPSGVHWSDAKAAAEIAIHAACKEMAILEEAAKQAKATLEAAKVEEEEAQNALEQTTSETDCCWRFDDGLMGDFTGLNPLRWSKSYSIQKGVRKLEKVAATEGDRPIALKAPAYDYSLSGSKRFQTPREAIAFLWQVDPAIKQGRIALETAQRKMKQASKGVAEAEFKISQMMQKAETAAARLVQAESYLAR
eukprot:TRINITY_DN23182_c0_g1_i1.p1 TRINITY_DN23182_c0_g1~~TRINITY_DN23182_c0_g1_i1.p1  ORF type:complete len:292 (+),score=40.78 TRINITY_DN23182_c0_g1_i1:63-878(+)